MTLDELSQAVYKGPSMCYDYKVDNYQTETTMTNKEVLALVEKAQAGDRKAEAEVLVAYEKLCHKLARKFAFTAPSHQHEDLFQEAQIGLLHAVRSYDPQFGAAFMTWAYYNVRGAVAGCGRSDRKQPRYPVSVEDSPRAYNVIDERQDIEVRDDISSELVKQIIEECCGGLDTKRANVVMDRYGLLGRRELRNFECAEKYGMTKYAVNSHTYNFKRKAREKFAHLIDFV